MPSDRIHRSLPGDWATLCQGRQHLCVHQLQRADSADTFAFGINNLGQVTGTGLSPFGGTTTDFVRNADGSFTTLTFNGSNRSSAMGINDSDQVVGSFANMGSTTRGS